jgi:integrase
MAARPGQGGAGCPLVAEIRWHGLRGTVGSRVLRKTRNLAWVQKSLAHASINTTMRHYAHVLNDDVRQAKTEVQGAEAASPAVQKLQGRPNVKLVG